jgi:hypothetical protein
MTKIENENRTTIGIIPFYQHWKGVTNTDIKQYSGRFFLNYFLDRDIKVTLQSGYASSEALKKKISGLSDAQFSINYKLRKLNTALDLGINFPTGEEKVDVLNFESSVLLCQEVFNIKMPLLRQGTNILAGLTWAKDLSDVVIIGLGISYQIKGKYNPIADDTISYKPSNELLFTGGIDIRISNSTTISGDVIGIIYGEDKINNINSLSAGTKTIFSVMFRKYYGYNNLVVFLRYRNCAVEKLNTISEVVYSEKISPNNLIAFVNFKHQISNGISLNYLIEGRFYEKTVAPYSGHNIYGAGIAPNLNLSSNFSLPLTAKYYIGNSPGSSSIRGLELGLGLSIIL